MPNVTTLKIIEAKATTASLVPWIEKKQLKHLVFPGKLIAEDVRKLSQLNLESLCVNGIDAEAASLLKEIASLKYFTLRTAHPSDEVWAELKSMPPQVFVMVTDMLNVVRWKSK